MQGSSATGTSEKANKELGKDASGSKVVLKEMNTLKAVLPVNKTATATSDKKLDPSKNSPKEPAKALSEVTKSVATVSTPKESAVSPSLSKDSKTSNSQNPADLSTAEGKKKYVIVKKKPKMKKIKMEVYKPKMKYKKIKMKVPVKKYKKKKVKGYMVKKHHEHY